MKNTRQNLQLSIEFDPRIAVLFARPDSVYKTLPDLDVFDMERDARTYVGDLPVIAHPPCRAWGRLRQFAKPRIDERELAIFAIDIVRSNGGVLEHPMGSSLWKHAGLPRPGQRDSYGGWTLSLNQVDFGHRARKSTWLYINGINPPDIPALPSQSRLPTTTVDKMGKAAREHTPMLFAQWLVQLAILTGQRFK